MTDFRTENLIPWPVNPPPVQGEEFIGYLRRLSSFHETSMVTLLYRSGVIPAPLHRAIPPSFALALESQKLRSFAYVIGQTEAQVRSLLLESYDGKVLDFGLRRTGYVDWLRRMALDQWFYSTTHHVCPLCLREAPGVVRLEWRLPWVFICMRHGIRLVDTCPRCRRRPGGMRADSSTLPLFSARMVEAGTCMNSSPGASKLNGLSSQPCGYPYVECVAEPVADFPEILEAQALICRAIQGQEMVISGIKVDSLTYFAHLRSLIALMRYAADVEDFNGAPPSALAALTQEVSQREEGRSRHSGTKGPSFSAIKEVPRSTGVMTVLAPAAVKVLNAPDQAGLAERLGWIYSRTSQRLGGKHRRVSRYFSFLPVLNRAWEANAYTKASFDRRVGKNFLEAASKRYDFSVDHVPQLFWEQIYLEDFAPLLKHSNMRDLGARQALSITLLMLTGKYTRTQAAELLGFLPSAGRGIANKLVNVINQAGHSQVFANRLHATARQLSADHRRLNYGERRQRFAEMELVSEEKWRLVCQRGGLAAGSSSSRRRYATVWLWAYLTNGDWRYAPGLRNGNRVTHGQLYRRFIMKTLPLVQAELKLLAKDMLREPQGGALEKSRFR